MYLRRGHAALLASPNDCSLGALSSYRNQVYSNSRAVRSLRANQPGRMYPFRGCGSLSSLAGKGPSLLWATGKGSGLVLIAGSTGSDIFTHTASTTAFGRNADLLAFHMLARITVAPISSAKHIVRKLIPPSTATVF